MGSGVRSGGSGRQDSIGGDGSNNSSNISINVTPRTLGTLNMSGDEGWRDVFVPSAIIASTALAKGGSLHLRLLVSSWPCPC